MWLIFPVFGWVSERSRRVIDIMFTTMKLAKWEISRQIKTGVPIVREEIDLKCIVGRRVGSVDFGGFRPRRGKSEDLKC